MPGSRMEQVSAVELYEAWLKVKYEGVDRSMLRTWETLKPEVQQKFEAAADDLNVLARRLNGFLLPAPEMVHEVLLMVKKELEKEQ